MKDYSFGNFLRELRERQGLSQHQLGALVGVSNKAVSKWENGSSMPKSSVLLRLSELLGVTVDELFACRQRSSESNRKGVFAMKQTKQFWEKVYAALHEHYGEFPPLPILNRLECEKAELEKTDRIVYLNLIAVLAEKAEASGHHARLLCQNSGYFTAYLLGASEFNPLPPHYFCPDCGKFEFAAEYPDCWDMPEKQCTCGTQFRRDGHDFPHEAYRTTHPKISLALQMDLGFFPDAEAALREYFTDCPLVELSNFGMSSEDDVRIERKTFCILPQDKMDFARANPVVSFQEYRNILIEYPFIHFNHACELDIHRRLEQETNTSFRRIPFLNLNEKLPEEFTSGNTDGLGQFGFAYDKQVLREHPPKTYNDLIRIHGMTICCRYNYTTEIDREHSICTRGYLHDHIENPQSPAFRDEIFRYIQSRMTAHGHTDTGFAYSVMRNTYSGSYGKNGMDEMTEKSLLDIGVPPDYIETLKDIRYIWVRSRSVLEVKDALIRLWYRKNYPDVFKQIVLR